MSGGTFEYKEMNLDFLADSIIEATEPHEDLELRKYAKKLANKLRKLRKEVKAIDYFLACDTSDWRVNGKS